MNRPFVRTALFLLLLGGVSRAADATWNRDADTVWNVATNWSPAVVPNGVGEYAWLTNNIGGNRTITIDAAVTIGHLTIGDSNDTHNFILVTNATGSLTFDTTNPVATLVKFGTKTELIHAGSTVMKNLAVSNNGPVTIGGILSQSGGEYGFTKYGAGTLALTNVNAWGGSAIITGGIVQIGFTNSLPAGNVDIQNGVLEINNQDWVRLPGSGTNQQRITGGMSGFSVFGGANRSARFGGNTTWITWGSADFNPSIFILNYSNANREITFDNYVDLNGVLRQIDVYASVANANRNFTNGTVLVKGRNGTLNLGGANRWSDALVVSGGAVRVNALLALSSNNVALSGGVLEFARTVPDLYRGFGPGVGQMQWIGNAGLGAHNGERVVPVGSNTAPLVWGADGLALLDTLLLNGFNAAGQITILNPIDLNGATRTVSVQSTYALLAGGVTNSGAPASLVKTGVGTLMIAGSSPVDLSMTAGIVQIGDYWRTAGTLPVAAGNAGNFAMPGGTLWFANPGDGTNVLSGAISGGGSIRKSDRGTIVMTGASTFSGNTTLDRGELTLDFSAPGAPAANILASSLTLGNGGNAGGTLRIVAGAGPNEQYFRNTTLNPGMNRLVADGTAGSLFVFVSNITRQAGSLLDVSTSAAATVFTTSTNTFGILGGHATFNRSTWATVVTNAAPWPIAGFDAFVDVNGGTLPDGGSNHLRLAGASTLSKSLVNANSLAFTNDGTPVSLSFTGATLRLGTRGGILVPAGAGAVAIGSTPGDGFLVAGLTANSAGDVIIHQHAGADLTINSAITTNGTGAGTLIKAGTGTAVFAGNVRISSAAYFTEGESRMLGSSNVLTTVTVNGGRLVLAAGSSNLLSGTTAVNEGRMVIDAPVVSSGALEVGNVNGARAVTEVNANASFTRVRMGANDGSRASTALIQNGGQLFSSADGNGTTIADGALQYGYYRLAGGTSTGNFVGAFRGVAVMDIVGGSLTPSNTARFVDNTGWTVINLLSGSLLAPGSTQPFRMHNSDYGNGVAILNILGGSADLANVTNNKTFDLMANAGNVAWVNLAGGVLSANQVRASSPVGSSIFTFNGGSLAIPASALSNTFMYGMSAAYILPGGAFIDLGTNSATIGQPLLAPTGYGVASIPVTTNCGGRYIGAPFVRITGGSGTGACAIAEMDLASGSITNLRVTSPGSAYDASDVLTVGLYGGGPLDQPTEFTISGASLAPNSSGPLIKRGGWGTLTLTNANTYTGWTYVNTGVLAITHSQALGSPAAGTVVSNFGRLSISGNVAISEPLFIAGEGERLGANDGALRSAGGVNTVLGPVAVGAATTTRIRVSNNSTLILAGGVSAMGSNNDVTVSVDAGSLAIVETNGITVTPGRTLSLQGGGTNLWKTADNNFSGLNIQFQSTLKLGVDNAIPTNAAVSIGTDTGTSTNGFLALNGFQQTLAQLRGGTVPDSKRIYNGGTNASMLTVGSSNASGYFGGFVSDSGAPLGLTKIGAGTFALHGSNDFTGATIVHGGTLQLLTNASLASTSIVIDAGAVLATTGRVDALLSLATNQSLAGGGTVVGAVAAAGRVAPGASAGTLTITADFVQSPEGVLEIELGGTAPGTGYDQLVVSNAAVVMGVLNVAAIDGFVPTPGNSFAILTANSLGGPFVTESLPTLTTGQGWTVSYLTTAVVLTVTGSVPSVTGYDLFATAITNGQTGYQDDADSDGYANLLEYVTGGSPTNADTKARMSGTRTNNVLALQFFRDTAATDATLYVEASYSATNNANWTGIATNIAGSWGASPTNVTESGASPVNVTVQDVEAAATNRFLRLRVTRP